MMTPPPDVASEAGDARLAPPPQPLPLPPPPLGSPPAPPIRPRGNRERDPKPGGVKVRMLDDAVRLCACPGSYGVVAPGCCRSRQQGR
jgi:hypothetical protein